MSLIGATVWVAIATTVLALGVVFTALYAALAFRDQSRQLRDILDRELRDQAAKTTAWLGRAEHDGSWVAHICNASDQPVFDVRTFFYEIRKNPGESWEPVLRGGQPPRDETICVFPPDSCRLVEVPDRVRDLFQDLTDRTCVVGIEFTDAAENRWKRDPHGALVPRTDLTMQKLGHPLAGLQASSAPDA